MALFWECSRVKITISVMFANYLLIAVRNFFKNKFYSTINIAGLAIGMACTVMILL